MTVKGFDIKRAIERMKMQKENIRTCFKYLNIGIFVCMVVFAACKRKLDDVPIAKVGDKYLYKSSLANIVSSTTSPKDSLLLTKLFIDNWIETQLLLQKAEINLSDEEKDISKEVETYRSSLLIYRYEEQLLREKLDTVVTKTEIETYYNENKSNFTLGEYAVKVVFLQVPKDVPNIDDVRKWYASNNELEIQKLNKYCLDYNIKHNFGEEWVLWSSITKEFPQQNEIQTLPRDRLELSDHDYVYLVSIKDKIAPGEVAPLVVVTNKVKDIIINKRKHRFISELEKNLYNDALAKKQFEIYH